MSRADRNAELAAQYASMTPDQLVANGSSMAYDYLPQNRIGHGGLEGLRRADAGVSIWDQLFSPSPLNFSSRDPDAGTMHYGYTNPFTAPNGQTYYSDSNIPAEHAINTGSSLGSEALWVNSQGNPSYAFLDDAGQLMHRFPGWGQGASYDPRWGEYVPMSAYEQWAANQQGTMDKLGGFLPALFSTALGGLAFAHAGAAGGAAGAGGAGGLEGISGPLFEGAATTAPLIGDGMYTVAPLAADGTVGAATTMGAGAAASAGGGLGAGGMAEGLGGLVDAGGDTMLNAFGGAGGALGAASTGASFWDSIFGPLGNTTASTLAKGLLPSLVSAGGQLIANDKLQDALAQAIETADPFKSQRPFYQDQLRQMFTDPNYINNQPAFQNVLRPAMDQTQAAMSARGYNQSGNMLHELQRTGVDTASKYFLPMMNQVGGFAGAGFGPGMAGGIQAQAGQANANTIGNIFDDIGVGLFNATTGNTNTKQAPNILNGGSGGGPNLMQLLLS